jgi:hypothetical protein
MKQPYELKIDAYAHIVPPRYMKALYKVAPEMHDQQILPSPSLYDLEARFRIMDKYEPIRQVLTLGRIPVEHAAKPAKAAISQDGRRRDGWAGPEIPRSFCGSLGHTRHE